MKYRSVLVCLVMVGLAMVLGAGAAMAEPQKPADAKELTERVQALEKENLVLREDLGKARIDAKSDLAASAKRQAEIIDKINAELADTQAKMAAERAAQSKRNRNLWIGLGIIAIGVMAR